MSKLSCILVFPAKLNHLPTYLFPLCFLVTPSVCYHHSLSWLQVYTPEKFRTLRWRYPRKWAPPATFSAPRSPITTGPGGQRRESRSRKPYITGWYVPWHLNRSKVCTRVLGIVIVVCIFYFQATVYDYNLIIILTSCFRSHQLSLLYRYKMIC